MNTVIHPITRDYLPKKFNSIFAKYGLDSNKNAISWIPSQNLGGCAPHYILALSLDADDLNKNLSSQDIKDRIIAVRQTITQAKLIGKLLLLIEGDAHESTEIISQFIAEIPIPIEFFFIKNRGKFYDLLAMELAATYVFNNATIIYSAAHAKLNNNFINEHISLIEQDFDFSCGLIKADKTLSDSFSKEFMLEVAALDKYIELSNKLFFKLSPQHYFPLHSCRYNIAIKALSFKLISKALADVSIDQLLKYARQYDYKIAYNDASIVYSTHIRDLKHLLSTVNLIPAEDLYKQALSTNILHDLWQKRDFKTLQNYLSRFIKRQYVLQTSYRPHFGQIIASLSDSQMARRNNYFARHQRKTNLYLNNSTIEAACEA